jgi:DNA primase
MTVVDLKKYIYNNSKIEFILTKLGCQKIKYHANKEYYSATQPDGDNPMGVVIYDNSYLNYRSYSRNIGLDEDDRTDIIDLVEGIKNCKFIDAVKYLHSVLDLPFNLTRPVKKVNTAADIVFKHFTKYKYHTFSDVKDLEYLRNDVLNDYTPLLYIGWYKEGIMPWTRKKFDLQYSYRRKRVIIPLRYWANGELLGINARTVINNYDDLGIKKYYLTPSYPKSANLYGLWENEQSIRKAGYVVVYEAEKSVLKRDSLNDSTGVALQGHSISDEQVRILTSYLNDVDIIIAMDKDVSLTEVRFMCEKFYRRKNVYYIVDKYNLIGDKDSPADASNKIFNYLMKHKVKYDEKEHKIYEREMNRK